MFWRIIISILMHLYFHEKFLINLSTFSYNMNVSTISYEKPSIWIRTWMFFQKRLCSIAMRLGPIDAEPNVQKKYYGLNPNLSNVIAIIKGCFEIGNWFYKKKTNCYKTVLLPIYFIPLIIWILLKWKTKWYLTIEYEQKISKDNLHRTILAIFQISIQLHSF